MFYNTALRPTSGCCRTASRCTARTRFSSSTPRSGLSPSVRTSARRTASCRTEDIAHICDNLPRLRGDRAVEDFPQRGLRYWRVTVERPLRSRGSTPSAPTPPRRSRRSRRRERDDDAPPVIKKIHKKGTAADPLRGLFERLSKERQPSSSRPDLRPPRHGAGAAARRGWHRGLPAPRGPPHAADAWYVPDSVKTGYENQLHRYFYKPQPLRTLEEIPGGHPGAGEGDRGAAGEIMGARADGHATLSVTRTHRDAADWVKSGEIAIPEIQRPSSGTPPRSATCLIRSTAVIRSAT